MLEIFHIILSGPQITIIPMILSIIIIWVVFYHILPTIKRNIKLTDEILGLNSIINNEIKNMHLLIDNIDNLLPIIPRIEEEIKKIHIKLIEIKDHSTSTRRNLDTTAQLIGVIKSLESLERSIEVIKERQITQAAVLSTLSINLNKG